MCGPTGEKHAFLLASLILMVLWDQAAQTRGEHLTLKVKFNTPAVLTLIYVVPAQCMLNFLPVLAECYCPSESC